MARMLARIPSWVYALLVLVALTAWELAPDSGDPVNPEALEILRGIMAMCTEPDAAAAAGERCEDVRYVVEWCTTRGRGHCKASQVYDTMATLGFKLPPLRQQRP